MVQAKPIVKNKFWILTSDTGKVGSVRVDPGNVQVRINGRVFDFKNLRTARDRVGIEFDPAPKSRSAPVNPLSVNGYPTDCRPYNPVIDVRRRVPLYTREPNSKSWYAAGWYRINQNGSWTTVLCPKKIMLDRYDYQGPFASQAQADEPAHQ